jgi:hypothetical protein
MPCSMSAAHNQILGLLASALPTLPIKYPDVAPPDGFPPQASWGRVSISDEGQGRPPPLVGEAGSRRYTTDGILTVELYVLAGSGRREALALGQTALGAYRGQKTVGGVWFRRERVKDVGPDGAYYHVNFIAEYQYDSVQ